LVANPVQWGIEATGPIPAEGTYNAQEVRTTFIVGLMFHAGQIPIFLFNGGW